MNSSEKLATKLRMLREIHQYTQEYVASVLDISPNTYSLMEKGQATFSIQRIEALAKLYKLDIADFLRMNDQTIIQNITHSNGICSDNVNINQGLRDDEKKLYEKAITRLEEQNNKLMALLEKLSDKLGI